MFYLLIILNLSEPYVVDIESYHECGISFTDHIVPVAGSLSYIHSKSNSVIPLEHRQSHTESNTYGVHIIAVKLIICLIIVSTYPVRTSLKIRPYIISVRYNLESCPERLGYVTDKTVGKLPCYYEEPVSIEKTEDDYKVISESDAVKNAAESGRFVWCITE